MPMGGSRQVTIAAALVGAFLVACGGPPPPPRVDPASVPAATSRSEAVTAEDLAADAIDRDAVIALLGDAGFEAGTELAGADRTAGIHRAVVRALTFAGEDGADAYLAWLGGHVGEVIGEAEPVGEVTVPGAERTIAVFHHDPGDCCPKATPAYLTAWRDGTVVVTVELAGPAVVASDLAAAAERVRLEPSA